MEKTTNRGMVTAGLLAALFIGALDSTVVGTAMPKIINDLNGLALVSWIFSIYTLTTGVTTPIFGKLSDLFGRKSIFVFGLALFIISSILCGTAHSMGSLIAYRALQGIGAGALTPVTFTIVGDMYQGEERAKVQGLFSSVWSVAGLLGPLVGGYFVDQLTWRWIFYMNLPIGIIAFFLVFSFLHEKFEKRARQRIDYIGAVTFTIGIASLMYSLLNGGKEYAWSSPFIVILFGVAGLFLLVFFYVESKTEEPMMPLFLFKRRQLTIPYIFAFFGFSVTAGLTIYFPIWMQSLLGYKATTSGLMLMPMSIAWPIASFLSGRFMYRIGAKAFVIAGALIVATGTSMLTFVHIDSPVWHLILVVIIVGFGMGCITTPCMVIIQSAVGWQQRGVVTSTNSLMGSLGMTVGVAVYGTILNNATKVETPENLAHGIQLIFVLLFFIAIANLIAVSFLPRHREMLQQEARS